MRAAPAGKFHSLPTASNSRLEDPRFAAILLQGSKDIESFTTSEAKRDESAGPNSTENFLRLYLTLVLLHYRAY